MYLSALQLKMLPIKATFAAKHTQIFTRKSTTFEVLSYQRDLDHLVDVHVQHLCQKQSQRFKPKKHAHFDPTLLDEAYESCRKICAEHATSYYLGTLLFTRERRKAVWAVYAWAHRTDELVYGANISLNSSFVLDSWEKRLEDIFNGNPHDIIDTALTDAVQQFPLDIKLFKDMITGMRMDLCKTRYNNYEELELYCYYVAGTVGFMTVAIAGISPQSETSTHNIYKAALCLGIGNQLTNILRYVVEDASMGRVYLPQDELGQFGLTDKDIFSGNVTENWRQFTKQQIKRARYYYNRAEKGVSQLNSTSRWPVWAAILLYRRILDKIEENNYDNLTKQARVGSTEKLLLLPLAYAKALSS